MPYSVVDKPSKYFNTLLWTGNGSSRNITGTGFDPNFVWIKNRSNGTRFHVLNDTIRGANKQLFSNSTNSEESDTNQLTAFITDGISVGTNANVNSNGDNFVSWNWLGSGTTPVSNTSGSRNSTVSANTTSGFSIVSYTGNSTVGTVGHGLGVAPKMMIIKDRSSGSYNWTVYHASIGNTRRIILNSTAGQDSANSVWWNNTSPTSTVFTIGTDNGANANGDSFIAYCFAEVKGFSKFGTYTGNNSLNNFVYTGFKPAFVMIKVTSTSEQWCMKDNKRNTINPLDRSLFANASNSEDYNTTNHLIDFVSNGFNLKDNTSQNLTNGSGQTYVYMAFAESPFVSSKGIPTTAR
jgi:hypothetical protein